MDVGPEDYGVKREENNVDILIRSFRPANLFAIICENKINNAPEQERQLERYYADVRNNLDLADDGILIVYLTPDGRKPGTLSLNAIECERLVRDNVLYCVSANALRDWLAGCVTEIRNETVRLSVSQYIELLRRMAP